MEQIGAGLIAALRKAVDLIRAYESAQDYDPMDEMRKRVGRLEAAVFQSAGSGEPDPARVVDPARSAL